MAKRKKAVKADGKGAYGPNKGLLILFGVVLIVLGIVLYISPESLEKVLAIVLVLYGLKKVFIGYRC